MSGQKLPWVIATCAALGIVAVLFLRRAPAVSHHPDPRPDATAELVLPPAAIPGTPGAVEAYAAARNAPRLMDGIYCYCRCKESAAHRSLLTCFESEHGAYCDICMKEAMLAIRMSGEGSSLAQIRRAIDDRRGS